MRKVFAAVVVLGLSSGLCTQERLVDRNGVASFFSAAPLENIEAINKQALGAVDLTHGSVAVSILMKGFRFEKALMEEHFNEKYIESDRFPKATFHGNIRGYSRSSFLDGPSGRSFNVIGEITIHGATRPLEATIVIDNQEGHILVTTEFQLAISDFDIKIPKLLIDNIAKTVDVKAVFRFGAVK